MTRSPRRMALLTVALTIMALWLATAAPAASQLATDTIFVEVYGQPFQLRINDDCQELIGYVGQQRTCTVDGQDFDGNPVPSQVLANSADPQVVQVDSVVPLDATQVTWVVHMTLVAPGEVAIAFELQEITSMQGYMTDPSDPTTFRWARVDGDGVRHIELEVGQQALACWIWFSGSAIIGKTDPRCPMDVPVVPQVPPSSIPGLREARLIYPG